MTARSVVVSIVAIAAIVIPTVAVIADASHGWLSGGMYAVYAPTMIVFAIVGWLISTRRPGNIIGPLLLLFAVTFAMYLPIDLLVRLGSTSFPVHVAATLLTASDAPLFIVIAMILVLFPDGRLPSPRWRWTVAVALLGSAFAVLGFTLDEGPLAAFPNVQNVLGIPGYPGAIIGEIGYICLIVLLVAAIGALVIRWRRGAAVERTQLKWVAAAGSAFVVTEAANLATFNPADPFENPLIALIATAATAMIPAAIGIAVLRYRLYEIDRVISRTISYAVVIGILAAVFVATVAAVQALLAPLTDGQTIPVAASTLVVFALFQPVLRRVRHAVDRRFDRARYDAERTAAAFSERLRDEVDLATVTDDLTGTTMATLAPTSLGVWLRGAHR